MISATKQDLPEGWSYVRASIVWHIAKNVTEYKPGPVALCDKTVVAVGNRSGWMGETRGGWAVAKLCGACRRRWTNLDRANCG